MRGEQLTKDLKSEARINHLVSEYMTAKSYAEALAGGVDLSSEDPPARSAAAVLEEITQLSIVYLPRAQVRITELRDRNLALRQLLTRVLKQAQAKELSYATEDLLKEIEVTLDRAAPEPM